MTKVAPFDRRSQMPSVIRCRLMDFTAMPEHELLRQTVRRIAEPFGHRYYLECARSDRSGDEIWKALGDAGIIGVNVPEEYGGGGQGISELALVCEELAAAGCPMLMLVVTPAICVSILARHGTEEQKKRWLPAIASGKFKMAFAITEPNAGSNSHRLETTAARDGDDYRLNGTKYYISGIDESQAVLVVTRTGDAKGGKSGKGGISLFVVDTDMPGIELQPIPMEIVTMEKQFFVFFDDVKVPADRLIGPEGDGLRVVFGGLNPERITAAATANGIGRYALEKAATYARDRKVWDVPIGSHQGLSHPLAKCKIDVELARLVTDKAAWLYDAGKPAAKESNMAKYAAAEAGLAALDQAIQTHGGNGLASEYGLASLWGLARLLRTAPVSREMILNYVAQHSLGLPRSY